MKHTQTTAAAALIILLVVSGGCSLNRRSLAGPLPVHDLDRSSFGTRPHEMAADDARHKWYAKNSRPWRHIVIHHSATSWGNASLFDRIHRERGWDELGYHFVIGNGSGGADGCVEVGSRWPIQKHGAHCGGTENNEYNELGIGICLVGDFSHTQPSAAQLASLTELTGYLMRKYNIPASNVIGHCQAPQAHTVCPGDWLEAFAKRTFQGSQMQKIALK